MQAPCTPKEFCKCFLFLESLKSWWLFKISLLKNNLPNKRAMLFLTLNIDLFAFDYSLNLAANNIMVHLLLLLLCFVLFIVVVVVLLLCFYVSSGT